MNNKPAYRFEVKSKRTCKKIKHYLNCEDLGYHGKDISERTDERMKDIALGIVMGLMNDKQIYVEVYKLNERGDYDLIRTQF